MKNLPNTLPSFLWHFVKQQKYAFFFAIFAGLVWASSEVLFPYFLKLMVNDLSVYQGLKENVFHVIAFPVVTLLTFFAIMTVITRTQGIVLLYTLPKFRAAIRREVFNYVKEHSYEYFANNFAGSIAKKLSELPTGCQMLIEIIIYNFSSITFGVFLGLFLMFDAKPFFSLVLAIWFCLHMGITFLFIKKGNLRWETHAEAVSTLSGKIVDSITNILNVRLFARGEYEIAHIEDYQKDEIQKAHRAMWTIEKMNILQAICGFFLMFAMFCLLIHGWKAGWVTLGDFSLVGMLTFWILGMVWYMSFQLTVFVRESGSLKEALSLISVPHQIADKPNAIKMSKIKGSIAFKDVSFAYQKRNVVFKNLNVKISAGEKVGLVGFSGSGKTTFVNLILRNFDLDSGAIFIDDYNIADVTQDSLRQNIAMIPQDPSLFHRTLIENIRYGKLDASEAEVFHAAKLSRCDEFIEQLDEGYQSLVGERGVKLSGGQRQRIAIARAILKNAPILILDEATSALDSVTEKLIQESMRELMANRTTIVVAHRLSTLSDMDRILVFHQGKIMEDGTQEELLAKNGHFAMLWGMQSEGFFPSEEEM